MDQDASHARRQVDTLAAMANDLAGQFALEPLLERILTHTMELLGCESGSICTVDEVAGTYRKEVDLGVGCQSGQTFPLDEGVTGAVVRQRSAVIFDRYADVPGAHIAPPERDLLHGVIGVPIRWNGAVIGTCVVFSRDPDRRFTDADSGLLELFATHAAIAITNARLHALAAERASEAATLGERERVVRDVHDTVGRGLAAILLHLDSAERALATLPDAATPQPPDAATPPPPDAAAPQPPDAATPPAPDAESARAAVAQARSAANAALTETRRTVLGLGPSLLDGRSLGEAIALELGWVESTAGVATRFVVIGEPRALAPETARQLFRITQEALTNVLEHARARSIRVGVVYGDESIAVLIDDDGRGFDITELTHPTRPRATSRPRPGPGLGLRGLVARAQHLGGSVQVDSTPGWGTRLRVELPYQAPTHLDGSSRSRWRVLVVHDSPVVRAGLVRMLALVEPDIQVVGEIAESSQVVDAYRLLRPHVVLTHLRMPHIDGVRLTSYLRAIDRDAAVVLLVDTVSDDGVREAAQAGAVGFVKHDVDAAGLARAVVAAARGDSLMTVELFTSSTGVDGPDHLTAREREVRSLVEDGLPYKQIAAALDISVKTVEKHVGAILRKTGAPNRRALAGHS
ncbi:GAF domain-containing protein [Herbiconiux daphne]|uniref:Oxygen sensor histidine kinase NreB n=1 Tax=Herbiconiux daphne TaxID=2970914 RepID=A0ABT2H6B7_9MICO|nr:GAF domain-containing protein [Herbiconiux daphne]MCS5735464.1 GAF domain-containing protein [Herbiconiux daphne]